jgi:predicted  nucleic acid-binding Zn-ribbon protein
MATCIECEEEYSDKRLALGYRTCLDCGGRAANRQIRQQTARNLRAMAPNHFTGSAEELFDKPDES